MRENLAFENFNMDEYLKTHFSENAKEQYVKNARILYEKIKSEYEKIHAK